MANNVKLLVLFSLFFIASGLLLILIGFNTNNPTQPFLPPQPSAVENLPIASDSATFGTVGERVLVTEVVDGDTIQIVTGQKVRLLGIDTPETKDSRKPVECFGKEASEESKKLLFGKEVILEKDISETDKYSRLLRYIYLPLDRGQLLFVNDYLIREGFARALNYPPDVKYNEQFRQAEEEAKISGKGLWSRC